MSRALVAFFSLVAGQIAIASPAGERLPARQEADGKLFAKVPASHSGVDLSLPIDNSHPLKRIYVSAFAAGGISAGDIDGDGAPDLFVANGPGENRLYRNLGGMRFEDITARAGVAGGEAWSGGAPMADVDGDGDLDVYACNYGSPNQLFLNDGGGRFVEAARAFGLDLDAAIVNAAFADYDRDGDLDAYLLGHRYYSEGGRPEKPPTVFKDGELVVHPDHAKYFKVNSGPNGFTVDFVGARDFLLRNDGGRFTDVTESAGISVEPWQGNSVTWWDYNADGWQDIYVANDFEGPDVLYRNNGNGTFTDVTRLLMPYVAWFSMGADAGDLDGDGHLDLLVVDMAGTTHYKAKTSMGAMGANQHFMLTADPPQHMRNCLFLGGGGGRFREAAYIAGLSKSDWSWAVKFADFDEDARTDVLVTNGVARNFNDSDNPVEKSTLIQKTEWSIYEDLPPRPEENLAFRNVGGLRFEDASEPWGLGENSMAYGAAKADFDGDGDLDLAVANLEQPVSIFENRASGSRLLLRLLDDNGGPAVGARVDVSLPDGRRVVRELQPTRGFNSTDEPLIHVGLDGAPTVSKLVVHWPNGSRETFEGLAADQRITLGQPAPGDPLSETALSAEPIYRQSAAFRDIEPHWEQPFADFKHQPLLPNRMSQFGPGLAVGDIDGDGDADLFVGACAGQVGRLLINDGRGRFDARPLSAAIPHAGSEDLGAAFFEADGDGDLDLFVVSGSVEAPPGHPHYRDRLYLGDGRGGFEIAPPGAVPAYGDSGGPVAVADFDRDGDLDVFVGGRVVPGAYPTTPTSHLLANDGGGRFSDVAPTRATGLARSGMVTSAAWGDLDADGWVDLIVAYDWGPVRVWRNAGGKLEPVPAEEARTGWWNSVFPADVDADGDLDLVAGNFGLNTKYHASASEPELIYYGDFDRDGAAEIVEAGFEDGVCFPHRGFSCSSTAMPFLREKLGTYHNFASATLADLYEEAGIGRSLKLEATTLESGIFINGSKPGAIDLRFRPLPREAQLAPVFGIAVTDVNLDGDLDLFLAQNFYGPQIETRPMAGGLSTLLLGDGEGGYEAVPATESGIALAGDSKASVAVDLDGDGVEELVVAENDGPLRSMAVSRPLGKDTIRLRLVGGSGNPNAIGAVVQVKSGTVTMTRAIVAGGGHLSTAPTTISLPASAAGSEADIRWPDGQKSSHRLTPGEQSIDAPGQ